MNRIFLVAGGDQRMMYTAGKLAEDEENQVFLTGCGGETAAPDNVIYIDKIPSGEFQVDNLVLPAPVSSDGESLNMPFSEKNILLTSLIQLVRKGGRVFGGIIDENIRRIFESGGAEVFDYLKYESFSVKNAVLTAEGAVQIALEEMSLAVNGSEVLVTGFGRISKNLVRLLCAFGAKVTVSARKYSDITWAEIYGCSGIDIKEAEKYAGKFDLVFNTVPFKVINRSFLEKTDGKCMIIDLASKPGGVDLAVASEYGIKVITAPGLPGKTAPVTAGGIIADTVNNIISERSMLYE